VLPAQGKRSPKQPSVTLSAERIRHWQETLQKGEDTQTLKLVVAAFRCAVHYGDENAQEETASGFLFPSAHVFNMLMQFCCAHLDEVLRRHVAGGSEALNKVARTKSGFDQPSAWPRWKRHQPLVKSYVSELVHFVGKLTEPSMQLAVVQQLHRLLPFCVALPKLCPKVLKALLGVWSSDGGQQSCLLAYASVRQIASELPASYVEHALKGLYLTYARSCRTTNRQTLQRVVLMSSCVVDVCGMDMQITYQHAFVYIRQLAIHLRNALQKASEEAYRQVYNWQYVNCLRLWAQVLCAHAKEPTSALRQLVYPLVQVCLGAARLLPNIRFAPLRFQCVRTLTQLSSELGLFVPVAPLLLEVFHFAQLNKPPKAGKERSLDWSVLIKVSKADAEKRPYQEGMMSQAVFLLSEHLHCMAYSAAFPEMAIPTLAALKKVAKKSKISALQSRCRKLVAEAEKQAAWVERARQAADFGPRDVPKLATFLASERERRVAPFSQYFAKELAAFEANEAQWRKQTEGQRRGVQVDDEDDDDLMLEDDERGEEAGEEQPKAAKKKSKRTEQKAPPATSQRKVDAGNKAVAHAGADIVEDLVFSDDDDDDE